MSLGVICSQTKIIAFPLRTWFSGIRHIEAARRRGRRPWPRGFRGRKGGPRWTRQAAYGRCPLRRRWTSGAPRGPCGAAPRAVAAARGPSSEGPSWAARCVDGEAGAAGSLLAPFCQGEKKFKFEPLYEYYKCVKIPAISISDI